MIDQPVTLPSADFEAARRLLAAGGVTVLSGAGLSTESGIPAYRDEAGVRRGTPMTISELLATPQARRKYWARAYVGWPRFAAAQPNRGHEAVARLQHAGLVEAIITQNVDGLQQRAGASEVIELHGSLSRVRCADCGTTFSRAMVDEWLRLANPGFDRDTAGVVQPDGDVALPDSVVEQFHIVHCVVCGSDRLRPDVVMFGESVPKQTVQECFAQVENSRALLVLGSSLAVMSGYRFVRRAHALGIPVISINQGWTRGDAETTHKLQLPLGMTLQQLCADLLDQA